MSKGIYTIVITGATKGLGRALTEKYIQLGHMVIGCGRSVNSIESMSNSYPENTDFRLWIYLITSVSVPGLKIY